MHDIIKQIVFDIKAVSRTIGLPICFHNRLSFKGVPSFLSMHCHPACLRIKRKLGQQCVAFDAGLIHSRLAGYPEGEIHQCPFGFYEIAVPVILRADYGGILFAGPCSLEKSNKIIPPPISVPDFQWLEDRLVILQALAIKIASLVDDAEEEPDDRKSLILNTIIKKIDKGIQLSDTAEALHLSPSRTGHLVKELFGETFPQLVNRIKMREAARMLSVGERPVSEISETVGFSDQNYFSRAFKSVYEMCPREYRKTIRIQA
jgi:AraC-like DNA-binding protein